MIKRAAGMIITRQGDFGLEIVGVHSVKRKAWGIPYGALHENESYLEAVLRECDEECGIKVTDCEPLYGPYMTNGHEGVVFVATAYSGEPCDSQEGHSTWIKPQMILAKNGPFVQTNRLILNALTRRGMLNLLIKTYTWTGEGDVPGFDKQ